MNYFDILLAKKLKGEGGGGDITVKSLNVTENGTYSEEGVAYSPVDVNVPLPENAYLLKDIPNTPTAIATFSDGSNLPMPKLEVGIEPVQDLHGYDAPWVGGSGKNKLKYPYYASSTTINGVTFTVNDDGTVNVNGTASADASFYLAYTGSDMVLPQGEYTLNGCPSGGSNTTYMLNITNISTQDIGSGANFTSDGTTSLNIRIIVRENTTASKLLFKPMIRLATVSDATYAPYSNICPISGWDEVNVSVSGVNVWDEEWESGNYNPSTGEKTLNPNTIRCKNLIPCKPNTTYYNKVGTTTNVNVFYIVYYDAEKNYVGNNLEGYINRTFTTPNNACFMSFFIGNSSYPCTTYNNDISINYPSTDTSYHAYNGHTYTIDLDGTRYGGTLDVVSGVMTITHAIRHLKDIASWNRISSGSKAFYQSRGVALPNIVYPFTSADMYPISSAYSYSASGTQAEGTFRVSDALYIVDNRFENNADFMNFLTTNDVTIKYQLATPITIQLTPTQVKSLKGINNVWADCGNILDLEYLGKEE